MKDDYLHLAAEVTGRNDFNAIERRLLDDYGMDFYQFQALAEILLQMTVPAQRLSGNGLAYMFVSQEESDTDAVVYTAIVTRPA